VEFVPTSLPEVLLVKPRVFGDARGSFFETYHRRKFAEAGITLGFVQDNHSRSTLHTLRGLHFQIEQPQGKLVRVTRGQVFDVVVDMRRSSPRFGLWVGAVLDDTNQHMLWVPPGFAHGYLALSENVDFIYKCTDFYAPEHERAVRWDDPDICVEWPLPPGAAPTISGKDAVAPLFREAETYP
jgi:dTDP-4-dehydrorhamnose 3,5-epimerase